MARIWAVMKDPGGHNAVWPVSEELKRRGHEVFDIATGTAVKILTEKKQLFIEAGKEAGYLLEWLPAPDAYLTSMCSEGGVGRDLIPIMRDMNIPTITLQDYWGGALKVEFGDNTYWPDAICVPDELGKEMVLDAWQSYNPSHVCVTGQPAFDKLFYLDYVTIAKKMADCDPHRKLFCGSPIVVYAGQLRHSAATLRALIEALNNLPDPAVLVALQHPRFKDNAPDEVAPWELACEEFKNGRLVKGSAPFSTDEWVAASDLVVSMTSTVLATGAYLRKECIAYLSPEIFESELAANGFKFLPMAKVGACAVAENQDQLNQLVSKVRYVLGDPLAIRRNQEKYFKLDGQNASRVADVVLGLIKT